LTRASNREHRASVTPVALPDNANPFRSRSRCIQAIRNFTDEHRGVGLVSFCKSAMFTNPRSTAASIAEWLTCSWRIECVRGRFQLHGDPLDLSCMQPSLGLSGDPIRRRRVILKGIDPLKSAIRPFGLDRPFVAVAEDDVKYGFFCRQRTGSRGGVRRPCGALG